MRWINRQPWLHNPFHGNYGFRWLRCWYRVFHFQFVLCLSPHHGNAAGKRIPVGPGLDLGVHSRVSELHADGMTDRETKAATPADAALVIAIGNAVHARRAATGVTKTASRPQAGAK